MQNNYQKIIIIGGVAGGASAAARLRRLNEHAEIIIYESGEYISFANCGLPYYIGDEISQKSALILQTPKSFKQRLNIDVHVQSKVVAINRPQKTVRVRELLSGNEHDESYDKLIIATGAEPVRPPLEGFSLPEIFTLRSVADAVNIKQHVEKTKPKTAVIVGGGNIGVEMAENLILQGVKPTIIEMSNHLIASLDYDIACEIHNYVHNKGIELKLNSAVSKIEKSGNGFNVFCGEEVVSADMLILSIGVRPESELARQAGLTLGVRGCIAVNEHMQTDDPDIYAVGDAVEVNEFVTREKANIALAGPANRQGRIAADNIAGIKSKYSGTQGSGIVKIFELTAASTGINESTAKRLGLNYEKSFTLSANHAGYYPGAENICIKTIFEKESGKILGAQLIGKNGTDKRCDVIAAAMRFGATAHDLAELELCYAPPYSSAKDPVNIAGMCIQNVLEGKMQIFHWHDVDSLPHNGSVQLIDVRTELEFNNLGRINGFVNIPLDELRSRLNKLDKEKPVYITCQIGQRGYTACRILSQNGFDCYNLSGGFRLYELANRLSN